MLFRLRCVSFALAMVLTTACGSSPTNPGPTQPQPTSLTLQNIRYERLEMNSPEMADEIPEMRIRFFNSPASKVVECRMVRTGEMTFVCPELRDVPVQKQGEGAHKIWVDDVARYRGGQFGSNLVARDVFVSGQKIKAQDNLGGSEGFFTLLADGTIR
jgi:hypothetical protein